MKNIFIKSFLIFKRNFLSTFIWFLSFLIITGVLKTFLPGSSLISIKGDNLTFSLAPLDNMIEILFKYFLPILLTLSILKEKYFNIFKILNQWKYLLKMYLLVILVFLKTVFWSLLLILPGIIKFIDYSQAIYVYADNPDFTIKECFAKSEEILVGNRLKFFLLFSLVSLLPFALLYTFASIYTDLYNKLIYLVTFLIYPIYLAFANTVYGYFYLSESSLLDK